MARLAVHRIRGVNVELWDGVGNGRRRGHLRLARDWDLPDTDRIPETMDWDMVAPVAFESFQDGTPAEGVDHAVYTDGSRLADGGCGYACVTVADTGLEPEVTGGGLGSWASPVMTETYAVGKAAALLCDSGVVGQAVIWVPIFSKPSV